MLISWGGGGARRRGGGGSGGTCDVDKIWLGVTPSVFSGERPERAAPTPSPSRPAEDSRSRRFHIDICRV
jgi:hypothetical protein